MEDNKEYNIHGAFRTNTKYGERIVLKINDAILYLPSRFLSLADEYIKEIAGGGYSVTKTVLKDGSGKSLYKLELKHLDQPDYFYQPYLT